MKISIVSAVAALLASASAAAAVPQGGADTQQSPPAVMAPPAVNSSTVPASMATADVPLLGLAKAAPTCGGLTLSAPAYCVTAPLSEMSTLSELYISHYEGAGWLTAAGDDNRIVFVRRRESGGCDGMQIIAFYDTASAPGPATPGYLGFATIPGNVCSDSKTQAPAQ